MRDPRPAHAPPKPDGDDGPDRPLSKAAEFESRARRENVRRGRQARDERDAYLQDARAAAAYAELVESDAWRLFLLPMLDEDVRIFQEHEAWSAPGMSMDPKVRTVFEARAAAAQSMTIRDSILTRVERGEQYYLEKAEEAGNQLERMLRAGLIRDEDLEERE